MADHNDIHNIVTAFNSLPRHRKLPTGIANAHWHISVRHVALSPPGDVVFFCQPDTHYVHMQGPVKRPDTTSTQYMRLVDGDVATTDQVIKLLLKGFISGNGALLQGARMEDCCRRPWSWSANDGELATRLTTRMRELGVDEALLSMNVDSQATQRSIGEDWTGMVDVLLGMTSSNT